MPDKTASFSWDPYPDPEKVKNNKAECGYIIRGATTQDTWVILTAYNPDKKPEEYQIGYLLKDGGCKKYSLFLHGTTILIIKGGIESLFIFAVDAEEKLMKVTVYAEAEGEQSTRTVKKQFKKAKTLVI